MVGTLLWLAMAQSTKRCAHLYDDSLWLTAEGVSAAISAARALTIKVDHTMRPPQNYAFDLDHCKGCGACAQEWPTGYVRMVPEDLRGSAK